MNIAYIFTSGRKERLKQEKKGEEIPHDFFFGASGLNKYGHRVEIFEIADFENNKKKKKITKYSLTNLSSCGSLLDKDKIKELNKFDLVIATNEYLAFGILDSVLNKSLNVPFVFFAMGMFSQLELLKNKKYNFKAIIKYLIGKNQYKNLIKKSKAAIFVGKGEAEIAKKSFKKHQQKIHFIPFPVDDKFWRPLKERKNKYILFMGNDLRRDFNLTLEIARNMPNKDFVFVSKRFKKSEIPENVKLLKGDWKEKQLSDAEIRKIINEASVVILPLKETFQPSGQSVAQQAMACEKTVIISKTKGFWDNEKLVHDKDIIFPKKNKSEYWIAEIMRICNDGEKQIEIGKNARSIVKQYYNLDSFLKNILIILNLIENKKH